MLAARQVLSKAILLDWPSVSGLTCITKNRHKSTSLVRILDGKVDFSAQRHKNAFAKSKAAEAVYNKFMEQVLAGGGPKGIHRHVKVNKKILPRDRIKMVLDEGSDILEMSPMAGFAMDYGDVPAGGSISVIGKVNGHLCFVSSSDATIKGGTIYPIGLTKRIRSQTIALRNCLPSVNLTDSGGAFLPLQAEVFPDKLQGGRIFRNQAVMQAQGLPQLSIVCGSCTAGGAYVPTMSQEAVMVEKLSFIFVAGPPLVKAAIGEVIDNEQLGGADLHCRVSGCADFLAKTEVEAFEICRASVSTMNLPLFPLPNNSEAPLHDEQELGSFAGLLDATKDDIYKIVGRVVDGSRFHEFKATYGHNLVTGFAHIGGFLVGLIANHGRLSGKDGLKGSHFVGLCNYRNIPMVFLQYSQPLPQEGTEHDLAFTDGIALKDKAKMVSAISASSVPRIVINIGGSYGDDCFTMSGYDFEPNFLFAWPTALTCKSFPSVKQAESQLAFESVESSYDLGPPTAFSCAFQMMNDGVVLPSQTRKTLIKCLEVVTYSQQWEAQANSRKIDPIFRM